MILSIILKKSTESIQDQTSVQPNKNATKKVQQNPLQNRDSAKPS